MTRTEIEETRKQIKSQIALLVARLNDESKRFYNKYENVLRSASFEELLWEYIEYMRSFYKDTTQIYNNLNESYGLFRDLQRLHSQLLELDVLEQAV